MITAKLHYQSVHKFIAIRDVLILDHSGPGCFFVDLDQFRWSSPGKIELLQAKLCVIQPDSLNGFPGDVRYRAVGPIHKLHRIRCQASRSDERRDGKEWVSKCRS